MSRVYAQQKRPGAKAASPSYGAPAVHAPSLVSGQSSSDLDALMQAKYRQHFLDNQIPTAEAEADRIAASVSGARTPEEVKSQLGEKMGADFSNVTFHTDSAALKQADAMGARAYTTGSDVYFGSGGFDPGVAAHELVHTVQQGMVGSTMATTSAPTGGVQMWPGKKQKAQVSTAEQNAYRFLSLSPEVMFDELSKLKYHLYAGTQRPELENKQYNHEDLEQTYKIVMETAVHNPKFQKLLTQKSSESRDAFIKRYSAAEESVKAYLETDKYQKELKTGTERLIDETIDHDLLLGFLKSINTDVYDWTSKKSDPENQKAQNKYFEENRERVTDETRERATNIYRDREANRLITKKYKDEFQDRMGYGDTERNYLTHDQMLDDAYNAYSPSAYGTESFLDGIGRGELGSAIKQSRTDAEKLQAHYEDSNWLVPNQARNDDYQTAIRDYQLPAEAKRKDIKRAQEQIAYAKATVAAKEAYKTTKPSQWDDRRNKDKIMERAQLEAAKSRSNHHRKNLISQGIHPSPFNVDKMKTVAQVDALSSQYEQMYQHLKDTKGNSPIFMTPSEYDSFNFQGGTPAITVSLDNPSFFSQQPKAKKSLLQRIKDAWRNRKSKS